MNDTFVGEYVPPVTPKRLPDQRSPWLADHSLALHTAFDSQAIDDGLHVSESTAATFSVSGAASEAEWDAASSQVGSYYPSYRPRVGP